MPRNSKDISDKVDIGKILEERNQRVIECGRDYGHPEEIVMFIAHLPRRPVVSAYCVKCDGFYERDLNSDELEQMQRDKNKIYTVHETNSSSYKFLT